MKCSECKYRKWNYGLSAFICHNLKSPRHMMLADSECECKCGEPIKPLASFTSVFADKSKDASGSTGTTHTNIFTELEPCIELYSVVCKIDTGVDYIHKEYLVNATSQEKALKFALDYFKNTAHSDEAIVGEPIVHVLRGEGVIDSHQVGCY